MKRIALILTLFFPLIASAVSLRPNAPQTYIVKPGDTLWSIANRYLERPWEWKTLWAANPQIKNPNRLYPGAVIKLQYYNKKPYLRVTRNGTIRLSPHARPEPAEKAIPAIPLSDIKPFLNGSLVLDTDTLLDAPYVVAYAGEHLVGGQGVEIFVKNLQEIEYAKPTKKSAKPKRYSSFAIYRPDGEYTENVSGEFLGYKAKLIGYAQFVKGGDPGTLLLTDITQGVHLQDRVLPNNVPEFNLYFEPKAPVYPVTGHVIDLFGGITQVARGQVIAIDRGENYGLEPGDVLAIYQRGKVIQDPLYPKEEIRIPQQRIGEVMIFRTFTKTSYGLIVRSTRSVRKMDTITNP